MKILVLQETDWIERGPHQQHHLFERLSQRGHEIRVIDFPYLWPEERSDGSLGNRLETRMRARPQGQVVESPEIELIRPPILKAPLVDKASLAVTHWYAIRRQLDEFDPDVVVAFSILNGYIGLRAAGRRNVPFVHYLIDHLHRLLPDGVVQQVAKRVERRTVAGADHVLTINDGLRDYAVEMGADPTSVTVIPGGVDVERYQRGDAGAVSLPVEEPAGTVLFFMGYLYEFSGLDVVAESLAAQAARYEDVTILVVGDGELYDELAGVRDEELGEQLILTGQVPFEDIPHYLDHADICLLPAEHNDIMDDIVPIKMYEYLAAGCPVVATSLPGLRKEFDTDNGVVFADDPASAFDRAMDLRERDSITHHAERGESFVQQYDWPQLTDRFETYLREVSGVETADHSATPANVEGSS